MSKAATRNRSRQKSETRTRLIQAGTRVFARDGISAASSVDIAAEAGLAHGTVFARFGTRDALVSATIEEFGDTVARRLHELCESGASTREVLAAHLELIREREDFYARLVAEAPRLPKAARDSLVLIQSSIAFHLSPALAADAAAGRVKDLSLHLVFNSWIGLVHHYVMNRDLFAPGASVIERRGSELLDHFMSMISKEAR
jgi:AcrR family transcriptional regulator